MRQDADNWYVDGYAGTGVSGSWRRQILPFLAGVAVASMAAGLLLDTGRPGARIGIAAATTTAGVSTVTTVKAPAPPLPTPEVLPIVANPSRPTPAPGPPGPAVLAAHSIPAACATPGRGVAPTPTRASFAAKLVGTWLGCSQTSVFGSGEAGLRISGNGRWSKLVTTTAGGLTPATGWGNEGTWDVVDTSAMNGPGVFQVDLHIDGSGTVVSLPVFSTGAPRMRLNNEGVYVADYVPSPTGAVPAT